MRTQFVSIMCAAAAIGFIAWSPTVAMAQQKTVKACRAEWIANKPAMQAAGKTEKAYIAECRETAQTAPAPAAAVPAKQAPAPAPARATPVKPAPAVATATPTVSGQFTTEAQAKARCPADTIVWVNLRSKVYHFSTSKDYGTTKRGAYMCEKETAAAGFRAAKNEKHP